MRLSDYEQYQMDEAEAEHQRLKTAAATYVDGMLASSPDPAFTAKLLIGDRDFLISCMGGFACQEVVRIIEEIKKHA